MHFHTILKKTYKLEKLLLKRSFVKINIVSLVLWSNCGLKTCNHWENNSSYSEPTTTLWSRCALGSSHRELSMEPCRIPEFWEIQICIDVPIFLHSIWELHSHTLFACTIDYMYFFQFLSLFSSFFRKKLEEIPFFQFLPFFQEETYFFRKFPNPGATPCTACFGDSFCKIL